LRIRLQRRHALERALREMVAQRRRPAPPVARTGVVVQLREELLGELHRDRLVRVGGAAQVAVIVIPRDGDVDKCAGLRGAHVRGVPSAAQRRRRQRQLARDARRIHVSRRVGTHGVSNK